MAKRAQPPDGHGSRDLFLVMVPITWLRAQPSTLLTAGLLGWEQPSKGSQGPGLPRGDPQQHESLSPLLFPVSPQLSSTGALSISTDI